MTRVRPPSRLPAASIVLTRRARWPAQRASTFPLHQANHDGQCSRRGPRHPRSKYSGAKVAGAFVPQKLLCEGACVMVEKGEKAIEIGRLQRYAVDHVSIAKFKFSTRARRMAASRLHRLGPCFAGLRGRTGQLRLSRHGVRSRRTSRRVQHLRHRGLQDACQRFVARSGNGKAAWASNFAEDGNRARHKVSVSSKRISTPSSSAWAWERPGHWTSPAKTCRGLGALEFIERTKVQSFAKYRRPPGRLHRRRQHRNRRRHGCANASAPMPCI